MSTSGKSSSNGSRVERVSRRDFFLMGEMMAIAIPFCMIVRGSPVFWAWLIRFWKVSGSSARVICVMVVSGVRG